MPCKKCDEGYKWGDKGECEYPDKESCENANAEYKKEKKEYSEVPSPINYKSFDDYKKAYDEYHKLQELTLSSELYQFNSVKQIGSMASKLDGLVAKLEKGYLDVDDKVFKYRKLEDEKQDAENNLDEVAKEYKDAEDTVQKWKDELQSLEGDFTKLQTKYDKAYEKAFNAEESIGKSNQKYLDNYDKADTLADKLADSIQEVKKQLKGLGISQVPDQVEVGEIAVDSFKGQVKNAMNDLMR